MDALQYAIEVRNRGSSLLVEGETGPQGPMGPAGPAGAAGEYAIDIDGGMANTVYGGIDPIIAGGAS